MSPPDRLARLLKIEAAVQADKTGWVRIEPPDLLGDRMVEFLAARSRTSRLRIIQEIISAELAQER